MLTAAVTVLALVAGLVVFVLSRNKAEAAVIYEPPLAAGANPFTSPVDVSAASVGAIIPTPGETPTESPSPGTTPSESPSPGSSLSPSPQPTSTQPFGGSGSNTVCDRELLIRSLQANQTALAAWARIRGVTPDTVPAYVRSLVPATLTKDTRVTNHSLKNGTVKAFQSILPAGTAVLLDADGKVVVRCRCGNPLLDAKPLAKGSCKNCPKGYKIPALLPAGFAAPAVQVINPPPVAGQSPSPTPTPTVLPTTAPTNLSLGATASASATFSSKYIPAFGIDDKRNTSWFSKGPEPPTNTSTFTIALAQPSTITSVEFIDNSQNDDPTVRQGFGFFKWRIDLVDASGAILFTVKPLKDPRVSQTLAVPSIAGIVVARFVGEDHEDKTKSCGGFGGIWLFGA